MAQAGLVSRTEEEPEGVQIDLGKNGMIGSVEIDFNIREIIVLTAK